MENGWALRGVCVEGVVDLYCITHPVLLILGFKWY